MDLIHKQVRLLKHPWLFKQVGSNTWSQWSRLSGWSDHDDQGNHDAGCEHIDIKRGERAPLLSSQSLSTWEVENFGLHVSALKLYLSRKNRPLGFLQCSNSRQCLLLEVKNLRIMRENIWREVIRDIKFRVRRTKFCSNPTQKSLPELLFLIWSRRQSLGRNWRPLPFSGALLLLFQRFTFSQSGGLINWAGPIRELLLLEQS